LLTMGFEGADEQATGAICAPAGKLARSIAGLERTPQRPAQGGQERALALSGRPALVTRHSLNMRRVLLLSGWV
jgi:hypothetical protein